MGRSWCILVGIAASACTIKDVDYAGKSCPCAAGFTCDTATNTCHAGDASIDNTDSPPGETCYGTGPTTVCLRDPPAMDVLQPPVNITLDTDSSPACATVDGTNVANACVIVANTVHVASGVKVTAQGSRPLVILGVKLVDIGGSFDVAAHRGVGGNSTPNPPGANPLPACMLVPLAGIGGGGGGSFGGIGGHGGTGNGVLGQAALAANASITPLRGGCNGGKGGTASAGAGGIGGGVVYLISGTSIIVMGTIDASGEGGAGAGTPAGGGGGGGAGGLVAFDAPSISVTGNVFANGGGGGGGSTDTVAGGNGDDPVSPGTTAAAGGAGDSVTGNRKGGAGSLGVTKAGTGGANSNNTGGGGGGGGGAGVIRVFPLQTLVGQVSPPAS